MIIVVILVLLHENEVNGKVFCGFVAILNLIIRLLVTSRFGIVYCYNFPPNFYAELACLCLWFDRLDNTVFERKAHLTCFESEL